MSVCYFCQGVGHWKKDYKKFLLEQKSEKPTSSGINFTELNLSTYLRWILDTRSQSHICVDVHVLESRRDLTGDEADIRVADGKRVITTAIGVIHLNLPYGLLLKLNNVYCVPSFSKDIISIPVLDSVVPKISWLIF